MRKFFSIVAIFVLGVSLASCTKTKASKAQGRETQSIQDGFNNLTQTQPIPVFKWSQERQTLIDVETIRANGATTTSAAYLEGVGMIWWCPSIGAPMPASFALSGNIAYADIPGDRTTSYRTVDQGEPTGVYPHETTGTWVLCLDDNGNKFAKNWEGHLDATVGIVTTYDPALRAVISDSTFKFTEQAK